MCELLFYPAAAKVAHLDDEEQVFDDSRCAGGNVELQLRLS